MKTDTVQLNAISEDTELLEVGRKAIEDVLVEWRNNRIQVLRNNGLVIKEKNGKESHIIRMGPEDALKIGLKAIAKHMERGKISNRRKHGG